MTITDEVNKYIVILFFYGIIFLIYKYFYLDKNNDILAKIKLIDVPYDFKCYFGENRCEEGDIDGWAMVQFLAYFIFGLIMPNYYLLTIISAVIFEVMKPYFGFRTQYIINPLLAITGYAIGSIIVGKK